MIHIRKYGEKRDYKKIDLIDADTGVYMTSTTWASSLKEAIKHFNYKNVKAEYSK
jgi:hypothetical protein